MATKTVIPFGPQHPVLPEPIHLDLDVQDETVVGATPSIGYIHRGLELLVKKRDINEFVFVAERICGICSFMHGMGYCETVEAIMGIEVPRRADYLRTIWAELSRIHSHLLWLGLAADAFGFENLFMQSWRIRELVLDIVEETTGGRVIFGTSKIGGVRRDIGPETLAKMSSVLEKVRDETQLIAKAFLKDIAVERRLRGLGYLSREEALRLGPVGPMARASGINLDQRTTGYAAYGDLDFAPITSDKGDCYARCEVRVGEIFQSIDLARQAIGKIPEGPVEVKASGQPSGETFMRVEQPRGEVVYFAKANGTKYLDRFRVRTPTFANLAAMIRLLSGCAVADVPTIVLTIDPCISCAER